MMIVPLEDHPREEVFTAYVSDTLEEGALEPFEQHVFACAPCAVRLQEHASFQELLHEAATAVQVPMPMADDASRSAKGSSRRLRRRVGMLGGAWAAAAAITLVVCQHGRVQLEPAELAAAATPVEVAAEPAPGPRASSWSQLMSMCPPDVPDCGSALEGATSAWLTSLASAEPLQSVDPLSSWPDDPYAGLDGVEVSVPVDGEPCGSGEDGGMLVCDTDLGSFSG